MVVRYLPAGKHTSEFIENADVKIAYDCNQSDLLTPELKRKLLDEVRPGKASFGYEAKWNKYAFVASYSENENAITIDWAISSQIMTSENCDELAAYEATWPTRR